MGIAFILIAIVLAPFIYMGPAIVAFRRGHQKRGAITFLNLLLGWTLIGWIGTFVWAVEGRVE